MIIAVASGKGGTGKTLVATSLALSIQEKQNVQFLDLDVEEPNAAIFLKPTLDFRQSVSMLVPEINMAKCSFCGKCAEVCAFNAIAAGSEEVLVFPELCHGCGACSYLCPEAAISERKREIGIIEKGSAYGLEYIQGKLTIGEAIATPVIREIKKHLNHDKISIIDAAPGTSCPVVETVKDCDFCLLVTEPTPFGLSDLRLAMEMVQELKVACGVVINRDYGETNAIDDYCFLENIPVLLRIPLDIEIARLYSKGVTLVAGMPHWRQLFSDLFASISKVSTGQKADSCVAIGKGEP